VLTLGLPLNCPRPEELTSYPELENTHATFRACNDCGCSNQSETEVVTLTDVPEGPQVVVYKPTACQIRVDW